MIARFPDLKDVLIQHSPSNARRLVVVTGHRRENFGDGFETICQALKRIATEHSDVEVVYPVHLNPNVQEPVNPILAGVPLRASNRAS